MPFDLTAEAQEGWDRPGAPCPHLFSSAASDAWHVGRHLRLNSAPRPEKAAKARGNAIRINGTHVFRLIYGGRAGIAVEAA